MKSFLSRGVVAAASLAGCAAWTAPAMADGVGDGFGGRLVDLLGIMHPILVHFPIALIMVATVAEIARFKWKSLSPDVAFVCLMIGAGSAVVATFFGLCRAAMWPDSDLLHDHRNFGIAVTVLSVILAGLAIKVRKSPQSKGLVLTQAVGLILASSMIGFVGHLGGDLTYGEGHLTDKLFGLFESPQAERQPNEVIENPEETTEPKEQASPNQEASATTTTTEVAQIDFTQHIYPILQAKCIECHGIRKSKGKLRMDNEMSALRGGSSERPLWIKGNAADSLLVYVVSTDDELDMMPPPDEGERMTAAEVELIRKWIDQGAPWPAAEPIE